MSLQSTQNCPHTRILSKQPWPTRATLSLSVKSNNIYWRKWIEWILLSTNYVHKCNIVRHDQNVVAFSMRTFRHHPMSFALHSDSDNAAEAIYWVTSHDHFVDLLNLWAIFILTMAFSLICPNGTVRTFWPDVIRSRSHTRSRMPWASFLMTSSRSFRQTIQNINERINNKL